MASSLPDRLATVHPKMLASRSDRDRKPLAELDHRRQIGRTIDRALVLARLSKQDMSHAMGYAGQSALARWISGKERPLFDKLFAVDRFYDAWVIACAEANPRMEVQTLVIVRRVPEVA